MIASNSAAPIAAKCHQVIDGKFTAALPIRPTELDCRARVKTTREDGCREKPWEGPDPHVYNMGK